ncbi:hypothetical protein HMPREF9004_1673 [Schaalia cardiffensis F0333]|uniref:Uncharacterized protein n=1 Tax=Schaalia cardiffensis F0333 TaxID=888050 RepID=N6X9F6_9ACTO|nr:hypothetical protein HMPREF9004_1673 [Schaalia cardiffensis F0333]
MQARPGGSSGARLSFERGPIFWAVSGLRLLLKSQLFTGREVMSGVCSVASIPEARKAVGELTSKNSSRIPLGAREMAQ